MIGVGLLEAVPEADILAAADPDDADGDGISGRPNEVADVVNGGTSLGRFGWKANVPSVEHQNAGAFHGDIGITSSLFPDENCPPEQTACGAALSGGAPELDAAKLATRHLLHADAGRARPAGRRAAGDDRGRGAVRRAWAARPATCPSCAPARATSPP